MAIKIMQMMMIVIIFIIIVIASEAEVCWDGTVSLSYDHHPPGKLNSIIASNGELQCLQNDTRFSLSSISNITNKCRVLVI